MILEQSSMVAKSAEWQLVSMGDVVEVKNELERNPKSAGLERYLKVEHLDPDSLRIKRWGMVEDGHLPPTFYKVFRKGQVLYPTRNPHLRRTAYADFDGICGEKTLTLEAKSEYLIPDLLPFLFQQESFIQHATSNMIGSTNPHIRWRDIASYKFLLPPQDEQRDIADILWAADEAVIKVSDVQEALSLTRKIVIADFVTAYRKTHDLTPLGSIIEQTRPITYGILKPGLHVEGGIPVIKVKDYPLGVIQEQNVLCTSPEIEKEYRRSRLKEGDLLLSIRGTVGRIAEVPKHLEGANITQDTARLSISEDNDKDFVRALLESEFLQKQMHVATTGLAVQGINIGEVRKLMLPMPSLSEQEELANTVKALAESTKKVRHHYDVLKKTKQSLLHHLLG